MTEISRANTGLEPEISVVVGSVEAERSITDCVASILEAASGRSVEVIVVDASDDGTAVMVRQAFPGVKLVSMPSGTLTPLLWSEGFSRSTGRAIAFTTGHTTVPQSWLAELGSALEAGAAGAGGPISLRSGGSLLDAAIFFLRYSAFMSGESTQPYRTVEIAGDNSMYRRDSLVRHVGSMQNGFWEVDIHRRLSNDGEYLTMVPAAAVSFGRSFPLSVISRHRFAHGAHWGRWRSEEQGLSPWRIIVVAPLVPVALLLRAARRVARAGAKRALFVQCSPLFLWLAGCWALGEGIGAMRAARASNANRH